jgi:bacterioferritin
VIGASPLQPKQVIMQGDPTVIAHLNSALKNELTAINQYFLHARMLRHWGVTKLGKHEYEESIDEMKHADRLVERVLFLGGLPNLQDLGKLLIGEDVTEILECDLKLEQQAMPELRDAIAYCETVRDYISRELFEDILESEEEHVDFLETQFDLIKRIGIENYIQLQSDSAS